MAAVIALLAAGPGPAHAGQAPCDAGRPMQLLTTGASLGEGCARLCTAAELAEADAPCAGAGSERKWLWAADTCLKKGRDGRIAFRWRGRKTKCITKAQKALSAACCGAGGDAVAQPGPAPAPTPAPDDGTEARCALLGADRERCQLEPGCRFFAGPARTGHSAGRPHGCHAAAFCGFDTENDCRSYCNNHRCTWLKVAKACAARQDEGLLAPLPDAAQCSAITSDQSCAAKRECEWVTAKRSCTAAPGGGSTSTCTTVEYGCHRKNTFCDFGRGTAQELEEQCGQFASRCVWACDSCQARTPAQSAAKRLPHIILSVADDLGWNDVGFHNEKILTPRLDALARQGIELTAHYAYRFCSPSRSMLLTGTMPWRHGQHSSINMNPYDSLRCGLQKDLHELPTVLKSAGYATHLVGKWHLGHFEEQFVPTNRGFDTFVGVHGGVTSMDVPAERRSMFEAERCSCPSPGLSACGYGDLKYCAKGQQLFNASREGGLRAVPRSALGRDQDFADLFFADEAARIVRAHKTSAGPLFLMLGWDSPHDPHDAPQRFLDANRPSFDDSTCSGRQRLALAGMMSALDQAHGVVVDALHDSGMWDDTLLVFLSDNGAHNHGKGSVHCEEGYKGRMFGSNYPLRGSKYTFWEGGIRTVSFVAGGTSLLPTARRGTQFDGLFSAADWFRTILAAAQVTWASAGHGLAQDSVDQWQAMVQGLAAGGSGGVPPRTAVPVQVWADLGRFVLVQDLEDGSRVKLLDGYPGYLAGMDWFRKDVVARRKVEWDRIHLPPELAPAAVPEALRSAARFDCAGGGPCLFNLTADPSETVNLARQLPAVVAQLRSAVARHIRDEVPLGRAGLCATSGRQLLLDRAAIEQAARCGSFAPWVAPGGPAGAACPPWAA